MQGIARRGEMVQWRVRLPHEDRWASIRASFRGHERWVVQGLGRRSADRLAAERHHCTRGSKAYSGCDCASASQSCTASASAVSHISSPRPATIDGGSADVVENPLHPCCLYGDEGDDAYVGIECKQGCGRIVCGGPFQPEGGNAPCGPACWVLWRPGENNPRLSEYLRTTATAMERSRR